MRSLIIDGGFVVMFFIDWLRMSVDGGDSKKNVKKISNDFIFGKVIGEGFYLIVSFRCFV